MNLVDDMCVHTHTNLQIVAQMGACQHISSRCTLTQAHSLTGRMLPIGAKPVRCLPTAAPKGSPTASSTEPHHRDRPQDLMKPSSAQGL